MNRVSMMMFGVDKLSFKPGPLPIVFICLCAISISLLIKIYASQSVSSYFEAIYIICFLGVVVGRYRTFQNDGAVRLLVAAIFVTLALVLIRMLISDPNEGEYEGANDHLLKLLFFAPVGWWLAGKYQWVVAMLVFAFTGLVFALFQSTSIIELWASLVSDNRFAVLFDNPQMEGFFFSFAVVGFLVFIRPALSIEALFYRILALLFISVGLVFSVVVVFANQTRGAWLALLVCLVIFICYRVYLLGTASNRRYSVSILVGAMFLMLSLFWLYRDEVVTRVTAESDVLAKLVDGEFDSIPYSSIGTRVNTWFVALEWILERPLVGWGSDVRDYAIESSDKLPNYIKDTFGHFHNSYIEYLLAYGLIGLAFMLSVYTYIFTKSYSLYRAGAMPAEIYWFTVYSLVLMLVMNLTESHLFFWRGIYVNSVVFAPAYTYFVKELYRQKSSTR